MMFQNLLLRFLFGFSTLCFAAGAVAIADGGAGDGAAAGADGAGADTGTDDLIDTSGDGTGGDGAQADGADGAELVDGQQQTDKLGEDKIDWRTVPQSVRNHLQEIKKTDPKLANMLQNAVYTSQTMLKAVPGGLKEIQTLKQIVDEAGGADEIRTMRETNRAVVEEQEDMDRRAASGDISVLDNLVEIAGDGFNKLMPAALDRWMQKDPATYSHAIGQIMVSAMQEGGVVADMNLAFKMLGLGTPEALKIAQESMQNIATWVNNVSKIATTAPEKPKVDPQIAQQQQQIDNERTQIFNDRFADRFASWRNPEVLRSLSDLAPKGKQFSDTQRNFFLRGVVEEIKNVLSADDDYTKSLQRIYNARNIEDLFKFTKSRAEKLIPEASKKVYRQLFTEATMGTKKPVQPGQKPGQQPVKPGAQAGAQPANKGWTKVLPDKAPRPEDIDNKLTDFSMKFKKAAVLKNGTKVYWGEKAPA